MYINQSINIFVFRCITIYNYKAKHYENRLRKGKYQSLNLQTDVLPKTGCELIFTETASGAKTDRIKLAKLLSQVTT